jgi:hypothetical protein
MHGNGEFQEYKSLIHRLVDVSPWNPSGFHFAQRVHYMSACHDLLSHAGNAESHVRQTGGCASSTIVLIPRKVVQISLNVFTRDQPPLGIASATPPASAMDLDHATYATGQ